MQGAQKREQAEHPLRPSLPVSRVRSSVDRHPDENKLGANLHAVIVQTRGSRQSLIPGAEVEEQGASARSRAGGSIFPRAWRAVLRGGGQRDSEQGLQVLHKESDNFLRLRTQLPDQVELKIVREAEVAQPMSRRGDSTPKRRGPRNKSTIVTRNPVAQRKALHRSVGLE